MCACARTLTSGRRSASVIWPEADAQRVCPVVGRPIPGTDAPAIECVKNGLICLATPGKGLDRESAGRSMAMDLARPPEVARQRRRRRIAAGLVLLLAVVGTSVALARLKPAAPTVDRGTAWIDEVKRGTMLRQVRGPGVLTPNDIRWIPATTEGRVERIVVHPGTNVTSDTVVVELSNPQVEQEALAAESALKAARAQYESLRADLQRDLLTQRASAV